MADFWRLERFSSLDSTSDLCKALAASGAPEGTAVTALEQTCGRGRMGRPFSSPKDCGLYLSVLLRPQVPPEAAGELTSWVAVALCDAVEGLCKVRPQIKWPNDLQLFGKKLCGILTEFVPPDGVVVGLGLNVSQTAADFGALAPIATSLLLSLGSAPSLDALLAAVLAALSAMYQSFPQSRAAVLAAYRNDCVTLQTPVVLHAPGKTVPAFAEDVDDAFGLVVRYDDGSREVIRWGEVSVRGQDAPDRARGD